MNAMFSGALADLRRIMYVGLGVKLVGAALRYWVGFDAYQGGIDAQRYHDYAVIAATDVWAGRANIISIFPAGTGTQFTEGVTALDLHRHRHEQDGGIRGLLAARLHRHGVLREGGMHRRSRAGASPLRTCLRTRTEPRLLAVVHRKGRAPALHPRCRDLRNRRAAVSASNSRTLAHRKFRTRSEPSSSDHTSPASGWRAGSRH